MSDKTIIYLLDDDKTMHERVATCIEQSSDFDLKYKFQNHIRLLEKLKEDGENESLPKIIIFDKILTERSQGGFITNGYKVAAEVCNKYPQIKVVIYTAGMYEDSEIEQAIRVNMNGLLVRNNLETDLIRCLNQVKKSEESTNIFTPALCKDISRERYTSILGKINKNLDIKEQLKNAPNSWGIFLHLAKGISRKKILEQRLYEDSNALRQTIHRIRQEINALIRVDDNQARWNFLSEEIRNGETFKQIEDVHYPIIAIILKVEPIVKWYKDKFGVNIHY